MAAQLPLLKSFTDCCLLCVKARTAVVLRPQCFSEGFSLPFFFTYKLGATSRICICVWSRQKSSLKIIVPKVLIFFENQALTNNTNTEMQKLWLVFMHRKKHSVSPPFSCLYTSKYLKCAVSWKLKRFPLCFRIKCCFSFLSLSPRC